ncbi:cytochrome P450 [Aquihabitans sp. McL0605]|uniref:cytochrome P450 n=1 Tax=Aquihabitans sp. McL0605 TaxID=3415671 RepID=UPI003CF5EF2F
MLRRRSKGDRGALRPPPGTTRPPATDPEPPGPPEPPEPPEPPAGAATPDVRRTYAEVRAALRDSDGLTASGDALDLGQRRPLLPLQVDGDRHVTVRSVLDPVFAPAAVADREATLRRRATDLIGSFPTDGVVELNGAFCRQIPVLALLDLLDLPLREGERIRRFHDGILGPDVAAPARGAVAAEIYAYFDPIVAERRGQIGPDLIRTLHGAGTELGLLTDDDIVDTCYLLLLAGIDPVAGALATFTALLADDPALHERVATDPAAMRRTIEEVLRWGSAITALQRLPTAPPAATPDGSPDGRVTLSIHAANHDPTVFADPDRFDPGRAERAHLSFGAGAHRCIGAHLARLQLRVAIEELHRHLTDLGPAAPEHPRPDAATVTAGDELWLAFRRRS